MENHLDPRRAAASKEKPEQRNGCSGFLCEFSNGTMEKSLTIPLFGPNSQPAVQGLDFCERNDQILFPFLRDGDFAFSFTIVNG